MRYFLAASLIVSVVGITGCEPKPAPKPHDAHDHTHGEHSHSDEKKETYASPAAELHAVIGKTIAATQTIADAASKGTPDDAHDQLHDIGHLLDSLPKIGKAASLDAELQGTLEKTTESLFDAMLKIDGSLHDSSKELKYDDIKDAMSNGIATLKEISEKIPK